MDQSQHTSTPKSVRNSLTLIGPPERRSSLAFKSHADGSTSPEILESRHSDYGYQSGPGPALAKDKRRSTLSPWTFGAQSSNNISPLRDVLRLAKSNLHRDMFVASSPASSIESRMHMDQDHTDSVEQYDVSTARVDGALDTTSWRYSTAPQHLAAFSTDVREPLPSPTLPDHPPTFDTVSDDDGAHEPASSGFTSPQFVWPGGGDIVHATGMALPLSTSSSPRTGQEFSTHEMNIPTSASQSFLEKSMENLCVANSLDAASSIEDSPIVSHLRRKSAGGVNILPLPESPDQAIYLSEAAEAAAESAKAKRRMLKDVLRVEDEPLPFVGKDSEAHKYESRRRSGIDIQFIPHEGQKQESLVLCPNPAAHAVSPHIQERPLSATSIDMLTPYHELVVPQLYPDLIAPRATATGSPMPFTRVKARPPTAQSDPYASSSSYIVNPQQIHTVHEHLYPVWQYMQGRPRSFAQPNYSFSTAASKVYGSSQAPDHRIRDSYKTDTLTALARPPSRYRKNGIGAVVLPRGIGRYYQRPPSSRRPSSARSRPSSRRTYNDDSEVRFRSSPPRALGPDSFQSNSRKRAMDDSFLLAEGHLESPREWNATKKVDGSNEVMELDDETSAAVRMSIFGTNTPEALHQARQGLRELSPNVQVYRKGRQEPMHLRKKRRPSYWDNDLKEIRESPAGRGGVNSPVSAQASMRAEFEIASLRNTDMDVNDGETTMESK